jgi:hypothetical protein
MTPAAAAIAAEFAKFSPFPLYPHEAEALAAAALGASGGAPCSAPALLDVGPDDFDAFWDHFPHKVGKPDARKAFTAARKKHQLPVILEGLMAYMAGKPKDRPWLNPATFLRQERFLDRPAATSGTQSLRNNLRQEIENEQRQGQEGRDLGYGGRLSFDGEPVHRGQLARLPARR